MHRLKIVFFALFILSLSSCDKENKAIIKGKITHADQKMIYLEKLHVSSTELVDSTKIDKNGEFKFTQSVDFPTFYLLKLTPNNFITLIIDSADVAEIEADAANFYQEYRVTGSEGSEKIKELNDRWTITQEKIDSIRALNRFYRGNPDYEEMKKDWEQSIQQVKQEQIEFSQKFVMNNPFSLASILALYQKFDNNTYVINDIQTMRVAASALHSIYPQSKHVEQLYQNTLSALRAEQNLKLQELIENQGENSPDIKLPDTKGKTQSLYDLRGKVVLVQFWSAVNRDSRIMNEALVDAYKKYHNKGFEIYQVSVDHNRNDWLEAIERDNLTWINVADLKGSKVAINTYNVQKIPYNYLLNKDGSIVAQNLKGPILDKTLKQLLN